MPNCRNCGTRYADRDRHCPNCGRTLSPGSSLSGVQPLEDPSVTQPPLATAAKGDKEQSGASEPASGADESRPPETKSAPRAMRKPASKKETEKKATAAPEPDVLEEELPEIDVQELEPPDVEPPATEPGLGVDLSDPAESNMGADLSEPTESNAGADLSDPAETNAGADLSEPAESNAGADLSEPVEPDAGAGSSEAAERDLSEPADPLQEEPSVAESNPNTLFSLQSEELRARIIEQPGLVERGLGVYTDDSGDPVGAEFSTEVGDIDLLAEGADGALVVVRVVERGAGDPVGPVLEQLGWVSKHLAADDRPVRAIVLLEPPAPQLGYAARAVAEQVAFKTWRVVVAVEDIAL